jgi:hypothetical protein
MAAGMCEMTMVKTNQSNHILGYPVDKATLYAQMLHESPAGLSEWAVHPGIDNSELLAMVPSGPIAARQISIFGHLNRQKILSKLKGTSL